MGLAELGAALGAAAKTLIQTGPLSERRVPFVDSSGGWQLSDQFVSEVMGLSPARMWRRQPHLRTVVSFMARNIAQLGLQSFDRVADNDRRRRTDDVSAKLLSRPNPYQTQYELMYGLVSDLALHDVAFWHVTPANSSSGWQILPVRAAWVQGQLGGNAWSPEKWVVQPGSGRSVELPADQVIVFRGWDPLSVSTSTSPVHTLKEVLVEQISALVYRNQVWKRGGRVGAVITRPLGHTWSTDAEKRFQTAFRAAYSGDDAPQAGGIPILQDGMTMNRVGFSAKEDDFVEGTKLSLATVAGVYHISPAMVGNLDNANYSNMREFRKGKYGDTLGAPIKQIQDRINAFLLPMIGADERTYVEFNVEAQLRGSFEESAAVKSTAVGAPWMTRNEARAMENRPPLDGGDELITPLNVLVGGQASPQDGGSPDPAKAAVEAVARRVVQLLAEKSAPELPAAVVDGAAGPSSDVLVRFLGRQRAKVLSTLGTGSADWWDGARWQRELTADLAAAGWASPAETAAAVNESVRSRIDAGQDPVQVFDDAAAAALTGRLTAATEVEAPQC